MNALYRLDDLIIEITERLMRFVQTWTSINNFAIARFAGIAYVTTGIWLIHLKVFKLSLFIFEMLIFVDAVFVSFQDETECRNRPNFKNHSAISPLNKIMRISILYGILFASLLAISNRGLSAMNFLVLFHIWLLPAMCYMMACTPLPPGNSKVLKWLRVFRFAH